MIYLNNAATSFPKPACVAEAVSKALQNLPGEHLRGGFGSEDVFREVRKELCAVLGVKSPEQIALGPNATWALNTAIFGLGIRAGETVVATKAEHNSVLRPLRRLEETGVRVILLDVDSTGRVDPEVWERAMNDYRPRLAIFSHASNVTGAINHPAPLCRSAHSVNAIILMDSSQTIGCIPEDTEEYSADMVAFTGHKYLLGPQGTGGLWTRPGLELTPYLIGGTGVRSDLPTMPREMPLHLEAGTGNEPSFAGLLAALRWQRENPLCAEELSQKTRYLTEGLQRAGANVIVPSGLTTPVVSFTVPGMEASEAGYLLQESCGIVCRTGLHCAPEIFSCIGVPETVRFSLSRFTDDKEIDAVIQAVEDISQ